MHLKSSWVRCSPLGNIWAKMERDLGRWGLVAFGFAFFFCFSDFLDAERELGCREEEREDVEREEGERDDEVWRELDRVELEGELE